MGCGILSSRLLSGSTGGLGDALIKVPGTSKAINAALAGVAKLVGALSCKQKGLRFDWRSGHTHGLRVWSSVWMRAKGNQSMFLSLSLSLPSSLSKISKHALG